MEYKKKTLIWEDNNEPPKDYIWIKADGKAYEFDYLTRTWVESKTIKSASGSEGGSTEGAITYNEQELTEEQKMQARKNQGVYYSENIEGKTITFDGNAEGKEIVTFIEFPLIKVADSPKNIPASAWKSYSENINGQEQNYQIDISQVINFSDMISQESPNVETSGKLTVLFTNTETHMPVWVADNFSISVPIDENNSSTVNLDGIYFIYLNEEENNAENEEVSSMYVSSFVYDDFEYVSKIDSKYLDKSNIVSKTIIFNITADYGEIETNYYVDLHPNSDILSFNDLYDSFINNTHILAKVIDNISNYTLYTTNISLVEGNPKGFVFTFLGATNRTTPGGTLTGEAYQNAYEIQFSEYNNRISFKKYSYKLDEYKTTTA